MKSYCILNSIAVSVCFLKSTYLHFGHGFSQWSPFNQKNDEHITHLHISDIVTFETDITAPILNSIDQFKTDTCQHWYLEIRPTWNIDTEHNSHWHYWNLTFLISKMIDTCRYWCLESLTLAIFNSWSYLYSACLI
jgi:hypothetical protein